MTLRIVQINRIRQFIGEQNGTTLLIGCCGQEPILFVLSSFKRKYSNRGFQGRFILFSIGIEDGEGAVMLTFIVRGNNQSTS